MQVPTEAAGELAAPDAKKVYKEGETSLVMLEEYDQSFDAVRVKYINLSRIKSVII